MVEVRGITAELTVTLWLHEQVCRLKSLVYL